VNCAKRTNKNASNICYIKWENADNEAVDSIIKITESWKDKPTKA